MVEVSFSLDTLEVSEAAMVVPYEEWHLPEGPALWKRLEVPGDMYNGSYTTPHKFNAKEFSDGQGYGREKSHHDRLKSWNERFSVAFAAEHFLNNTSLGSPNPKILEIGCWPMRKPDVETKDDNSVLGIISQNPNYNVVGVDNIDISRVFPYKSYNLPNFGNALFINDNFYSSNVQKKVIKHLGGNPHMIIGNMVFDRRLGNFAHRYVGTPSEIAARNSSQDGPERTQAGENIASEAYGMLRQGGVIVIANEGKREVPDFIASMPLVAVYLQKNGYDTYAQVRKKI